MKIDYVESMRDMMRSCYAYGSIERGSYDYDKYIAKYEKDLGTELFNTTYERMYKELSKYEVQYNVYEDSEGCTYNSLVLKEADIERPTRESQ